MTDTELKKLTDALLCPNCPNQGWYAVPNHQTEEIEQVPCEFCNTEPNSVFNIARRRSTMHQETYWKNLNAALDKARRARIAETVRLHRKLYPYDKAVRALVRKLERAMKKAQQ